MVSGVTGSCSAIGVLLFWRGTRENANLKKKLFEISTTSRAEKVIPWYEMSLCNIIWNLNPFCTFPVWDVQTWEQNIISQMEVLPPPKKRGDSTKRHRRSCLRMLHFTLGPADKGPSALGSNSIPITTPPMRLVFGVLFGKHQPTMHVHRSMLTNTRVKI